VVAAAVREERGRARCGLRVASVGGFRCALSLQTGLAVWPVGCRRRGSRSLSLPSSIGPSLPTATLRARRAKVCRLLSLSLHCPVVVPILLVCPPLVLPVSRRRNLSPPADSTTPALPAAAAIYSLLESCYSDHHLRPHRTEAIPRIALREAQHGHSRPRRNLRTTYQL
jgi:hypothetical protein